LKKIILGLVVLSFGLSGCGNPYLSSNNTMLVEPIDKDIRTVQTLSKNFCNTMDLHKENAVSDEECADLYLYEDNFQNKYNKARISRFIYIVKHPDDFDTARFNKAVDISANLAKCTVYIKKNCIAK